MTKIIILFTFLVCFIFQYGFAKEQSAYFAGGCFWCMEKPFEELDGVKSVISGYLGGDEENPKYKQVAGGKTGHRESIKVIYDDKKISYQKILETYWKTIDPTDNLGQFVDRGFQYAPAIFFNNDKEKKLATESKELLERNKVFSKPISILITKAKTFYPAEDYHQDYYKKNPIRYKYYRYNSGRDQFLDKIWKRTEIDLANKIVFKRPSKKELKKQLSKIQFEVTQEDGTERPFKNEYWDNKKPGIYVDIVSKEPLFSSTDKFKSGTGWPSFTKPLVSSAIVEKPDSTFGMTRTEVRSKLGDSHLGHLFTDGPAPTGLRYCINSAALEFIPVEKLKERGYERFLNLFNETDKNGNKLSKSK